MVLLAIALGILPGFVWLWFYLKEEAVHPEPKKLIAVTFFAGALVTLIALVLQCVAFKNLFPFQSCSVRLEQAVGSLSIYGGIGLILLLALIEEVLKFWAAYFSVNKEASFNRPVDAMIYAVVAGLGFATVENLAVASTLVSASGSFETMIEVFHNISFRFVGATLLHTLASAIVGYYWARSIRGFEDKKYIVYGVILATILHAAFNYLIIIFDDRFYTIVLLLVIGFFVLTDFEKLKSRNI